MPATVASKKKSAKKNGSASPSPKRGRPLGSKNRPKDQTAVPPADATAPKKRGRPPKLTPSGNPVSARGRKPNAPAFELITNKASAPRDGKPAVNVIEVPSIHGNDENLLPVLKDAIRRGILKEGDVNVLLASQAPKNTTISLTMNEAITKYSRGTNPIGYRNHIATMFLDLIRDGIFGKLFPQLEQTPKKERAPRQSRGKEAIRFMKLRKAASLAARTEMELPSRGRIPADQAEKFNALVEKHLAKLDKEAKQQAAAA